MYKGFCNRLLLLLTLSISTQCLLAQFEEGKTAITIVPISGSALVSNANNTVSYAPATGEVSKKIVNILTFSIDENSNTYPQSGFTATLNYSVEKTSTLNPLSSPTTETGTLLVNLDTATGAKYTSRAYFVFPDSYERIKVTITNITISGNGGTWDPKSILRLENEMRVTRYFTLSNNTVDLTPSFNATVNYGDELGVSWSWPQTTYNNLSQIEYSWLENELAGYYTVSNSVNTDALFRDNSTRVDIDFGKDSFHVPLLYPNAGKLYYRVRAIMRKADGSLISGTWSPPQTFDFAGHQPNLNWQSTTSFAENGKHKTVIQYFDGSLRSRQTVTKDNEMGNAIVGETIYDLQGRPNVQILPTPTLSNSIQYYTNFNLFQGQQDSTVDPARFFDLSIAATKCNAAPALDITHGNGRYYSASNDWLGQERKANYIPDAQGYAYTETRFMDDATERVSVQGGVGSNHQIGSGHETRYFYGKPSQQELDALFATEVGDASHYSKNMVQDANGQMSVSYTDMHGRTIATALAGDAPSNLVSIANPAYYPQSSDLLTTQLLTPATNMVKGNVIEAVNTVLVPASTTYHFSYALDPAVVSQYTAEATPRQICFDCKYDLEISIRPENCDGTPIVKKYSNLQIVPGDQSCGTSMGFVGEGISTPVKQIDFDQELSPGSWSIRKTLTINDSMFAIRKDSALKVFLVKTQQSLYDSIYTVLSNSSGCTLPAGNTAACDSCIAQLGSFAQYQTKYLARIGNPVGYDVSRIQAQYTQDSLTCAEACGHSSSGFSTLTNLRLQMLSDVTPFTGQYAADPMFDANGNATAITAGSLDAKYNIFMSTPLVSGTTKPFYKNPVTETGASSSYPSPDGSSDNGLTNAAGQNILPSLDPAGFTSLFQPNWAGSLVYYHPEFYKLKYVETNMVAVYNWLDKVNFTDSYAAAQTAGYLTPLTSDPYYANGFASGAEQTAMSQNLSSHIDNNASKPSIWQLANASVLCNGAVNQQACIMQTTAGGLSPAITTTVNRDKVWQRFKSLYLHYRNEKVNNYITTHATGNSSGDLATLKTTFHKQLVFTSEQDEADQSGAGAMWTAAINSTQASDTATIHALANSYVSSNISTDYCISQRTFWEGRLMQCEQLQHILLSNLQSDTIRVRNIINTILDSLVMVCHNSQTALQPNGATNVNPAFTGTPRTFEEIVNHVFANNNIANNSADSSYFCNPFSIDAPKPFGKNLPLFRNYAASLDSCNCNAFASLKAQAIGAGFAANTQHGFNQFLVAGNYGDTISNTLWAGLQNCSQLYTDTCALTTSVAGKTYTGSLAARSTIRSMSKNSRFDISNIDSCIVYNPVPLANVVSIPAFLSCGYQKPCISCLQFSTLTTEFITLYPNYSGVPYRGDTLSDVQISRNNLWARFLNYRTGFNLNAFDYTNAFNNCNGSITGYIGDGNDCGTGSAVDSLLVPSRTTPFGNAYTARKVIIFQDSFESTGSDEFVASINSTLDSCTNNNYGIAGTPIGGTGDANASLCISATSLNDIANFEPVDTVPCQAAQTQSLYIAQMVYEQMKDSLVKRFDSLYSSICLQARNSEQFYATYQPAEYHYTLYYYDQAGNLVKTLPPAAVKPNFDATYLASVQAARLAATDVATLNNEVMATNYRYNTLNQVVAQNTPDAHLSRFWYDRLGRLAVSQNAKQLQQTKYSYTIYDVLGRITEVGQKPQSTGMTQTISQDTTALKDWLNNSGAGLREQITATVYDVRNTAVAGNTDIDAGVIKQNNLRNRVSYTMLFDSESQMAFTAGGSLIGGASATYYSYDIHGNVDTLVQDFKASMPVPNRFKKIDYQYDLISGKVNLVAYQEANGNAPDRFYHRYSYDAENRITGVFTSRDSIYWEKDANYEYYRHGPLARTELGQNRVQGVDYAYTIQGWLKGVNASVQNSPLMDEMGQDGIIGSPNATVARDAFGFSLHYFDTSWFQGFHNQIHLTDYTPIGESPFITWGSTTDPSTNKLVSLYNGNIASMLVDNVKLNNPQSYIYRYDQLNRIKSMDVLKQAPNTTLGSGYLETVNYHEEVNYDPNGNILTYLRNGSTDDGISPLAMDNLTYQYEKNSSGNIISNKLRYVHDQVADANYSNDIDNQTSLTLAQVQADNNASQAGDNYQYDAIGNLIKDVKEGITNINWTVYGKIQSITKSDGTQINYGYDPSGNRISKSVTKASVTTNTYYVRDATGNTLSVYTSGNTAVNGGNMTQSEIHLYGSSRLGILNTNTDVTLTATNSLVNFIRGNKFFELSNHLGNVLATVSDKKLPHSSNNTSIDFYNADVVSANDYYPFGMQMVGRKYSQANSGYRYGFNGKEQDRETTGTSTYDYGFRIYSPSLGRFLSVDPLTKNYPWYTPYQFAGNKPIWCADVDGKEEWFKTVVDALTSWVGVIARVTKSTYTASIGLDAKSGAFAFSGAAISGSIGVGIDSHQNIAFTATGQSWFDFFAVYGGVAWGTRDNDNSNTLKDGRTHAFTIGANIGIEFAGAWNKTDHIEQISGTTKEVELDFDIAEVTLGYDDKGEFSSFEVAAGPGLGGASLQVSTSVTKVLGVQSEDLNQMVNVMIEAEKAYQVNGGSNLKPSNNSIAKGFRIHKDGNRIDFYAEVTILDAQKKEQTIFSKVALTLFQKNEDYIRTQKVADTEKKDDENSD